MKSLRKFIEILFIIFLFLFSIYNLALYTAISDNKPTPDYQTEKGIYWEDIIILFFFVFMPFIISILIITSKISEKKRNKKK